MSKDVVKNYMMTFFSVIFCVAVFLFIYNAQANDEKYNKEDPNLQFSATANDPMTEGQAVEPGTGLKRPLGSPAKLKLTAYTVPQGTKEEAREESTEAKSAK